MKTRLTIRAHARRFVTGLTIVLAATLLVSGSTIGNEADEPVIVDQAMQVAWLRDHFCCEHATEMAEA